MTLCGQFLVTFSWWGTKKYKSMLENSYNKYEFVAKEKKKKRTNPRMKKMNCVLFWNDAPLPTNYISTCQYVYGNAYRHRTLIIIAFHKFTFHLTQCTLYITVFKALKSLKMLVCRNTTITDLLWEVENIYFFMLTKFTDGGN